MVKIIFDTSYILLFIFFSINFNGLRDVLLFSVASIVLLSLYYLYKFLSLRGKNNKVVININRRKLGKTIIAIVIITISVAVFRNIIYTLFMFLAMIFICFVQIIEIKIIDKEKASVK
jgi:hypothetical protein